MGAAATASAGIRPAGGAGAAGSMDIEEPPAQSSRSAWQCCRCGSLEAWDTWAGDLPVIGAASALQWPAKASEGSQASTSKRAHCSAIRCEGCATRTEVIRRHPYARSHDTAELSRNARQRVEHRAPDSGCRYTPGDRDVQERRGRTDLVKADKVRSPA